jgi:hypothetical protein
MKLQARKFSTEHITYVFPDEADWTQSAISNVCKLITAVYFVILSYLIFKI